MGKYKHCERCGLPLYSPELPEGMTMIINYFSGLLINKENLCINCKKITKGFEPSEDLLKWKKDFDERMKKEKILSFAGMKIISKK